MTSHDMHILVLAGGLSAERDVSLRSGRRVAEALRDRGHSVEVADVDSSLLGRLKADPPTAVVPLVHGAAGEDGALRDVLDALGIVYVGSTGDACRAAFDKPAAAARLRSHGINVPSSVALPHSTFRDLGATSVLDAFAQSLGMPLVVKPTRGGSALGVTIVNEPSELSAAMVGAFAYGDTVMLERYIEGVEIAVSIFDDGMTVTALPAVEIQPDAVFYDYQCRYTAGATEFFVPARLDASVLASANEIALAAHRELGLRDWSRADIIVDSSGGVHVLEMCVAPGMTETSLYPQAISAAGLDLGELTAQLVVAAIDRAGN